MGRAILIAWRHQLYYYCSFLHIQPMAPPFHCISFAVVVGSRALNNFLNIILFEDTTKYNILYTFYW